MPPLCIITHFSCSLCFGCIDIVYWNVRWNGSKTIAPEKNCLLQPKTNPNPNSNPIQGAVFLRDNCLDRNPMWGWEVIFRTPIKYTLLSFTFLLILLICVFEQCFEILRLVNNPGASFCFVQNTESLLWNFLEC